MCDFAGLTNDNPLTKHLMQTTTSLALFWSSALADSKIVVLPTSVVIEVYVADADAKVVSNHRFDFILRFFQALIHALHRRCNRSSSVARTLRKQSRFVCPVR